MYEGIPQTHWEETVTDSILEQYRDSPKWQGCLKAVIEQMGNLETVLSKLSAILDFRDVKSGEDITINRLDFIASLLNLVRDEGEGNNSFLARFHRQVGSINSGTPENVIAASAIKSKYDAIGNSEDLKVFPQYMDESPCVAFIYTPEGAQLSRSFVKSLGAAGTLVLPGAGLAMSDGKLLGTKDQKVILAVADDKNLV